MRLAAKLTFGLVLGILAVMVGYAWLEIHEEVKLYESDLHRARYFGLAWLGAIESVWQREGEARVRELIERADARSHHRMLRLVSLDPGVTDPVQGRLTAAAIRALRRGNVVRVVETDRAGERWRYTYAALADGPRAVAVELAEPLVGQQTFIRMSHVAIVLATIAIVLVCGVIATVLQVWFVGRPLRALRDKARRIAAGDFSGPLLLRQRDEIGELAAELNAMCERLAEARQRVEDETEQRMVALEQLRHSERLATVGQLAAGVAHELGTPLSVVSARAQMIASPNVAVDEVVRHARVIVEQADRMTEIIQQLLDFSRRRTTRFALGSLQHVVARTLDLVRPAAERAGVMIACEAPQAPLLARVDENQLQQALANVVLNGIQAMTRGGRLTVSLGERHVRPPAEPGGPEGEYLCVTVTDVGHGMSPEQIGRIFEPFFTTKPPGDGTGLGLAVAHGIVSEHGGWIEVASVAGEGSRFSIFLPHPTGKAGAMEVAS